MFGLKDVSEYFSSKLYKYVIGVVNLETLYGLREQLPGMDVFIVNTGKKLNGVGFEVRGTGKKI